MKQKVYFLTRVHNSKEVARGFRTHLLRRGGTRNGQNQKHSAQNEQFEFLKRKQKVLTVNKNLICDNFLAIPDP